MSRRHIFLLAFLAGLAPQFFSQAHAGEVDLPSASGADFQLHVKSIKELRDARIVKQEFDFSCGSAALATLLTYSYNMPTSERDAFNMMYAVGDQPHIKRYGFSLLDMQKYLASRGLHAVGYKMTLERLRKLHIPAIVMISPNGYNHFVVVRGWRNDSAIVADPRLGLRRIPEEDFRAVWNGVVFALRDDYQMAENFYNDPRDLAVLPLSHEEDGMYYAHETSTISTILQPKFNDY